MIRAIGTLMLGCLALCAQAQTGTEAEAWRDSSEAFWGRLEAEFADPATSPLTPEDRTSFTRLDRFPYDPAFRVTARFTPAERPRIFKMRTTTSREPLYRPYGTLVFTLGGKEFSLTVYQNIELIAKEGHADHLFLPFTDRTNGTSTYGGGRYIDLQGPLGEVVVVDLNHAYNPYCCYNSRYSCPVPPKENDLDVAVKAGVKAFGEH